MSLLTFKDLVDLKADEWNTKVAAEYNISVEELKDQVIRRDLRLLDNRIIQHITKDEIETLAEEQKILDKINLDYFNDGDSETIYESISIDKFKIKITNTEDIVDSIAITGKIIIGANFSKSNLSNSYFCGCIFYQCNLSNVDVSNSVFIGCDFVACNMNSIDFNGSTISRVHIYESDLTKSLLDYAVISDGMIVDCNLTGSSVTQARVLFIGFSDCHMESVNWKDSDIVQCTYTLCSCNDSDFKRVTLVDSILIRTSLIGCDLNSISVTCLTISECQYDMKYKHFFEMESLLYSPSIFEWEDTENIDDDSYNEEDDGKIW